MLHVLNLSFYLLVSLLQVFVILLDLNLSDYFLDFLGFSITVIKVRRSRSNLTFSVWKDAIKLFLS